MKSSISVYTWFETGNEKKVVSSDILSSKTSADRPGPPVGVCQPVSRHGFSSELGADQHLMFSLP